MAKWSDDDWDSSSPIGSPSSTLPHSIREVFESVRAERSESTLESSSTSSKDNHQNSDAALTEASDIDVQEEVGKPSQVNESEEWRINCNYLPEAVNTNSHIDVEGNNKKLEPARSIQGRNTQNQTHTEDSHRMRKDRLNLNKMLAECQYNKAGHWIKIASPAKKMGHEMLEPTTHNHQTKISKLLSTVNSKDCETMNIQGLKTQMKRNVELKQKVPLESDAITEENVGDACVLATKKIDSIKISIEKNHPHESSPMPVRQISKYVDLTDESDSNGLIMQSVEDESVPTFKKRKTDVEETLETEMRGKGTKAQDLGYVDLTDEQETSGHCPLKFEEQDECEPDTLVELEKGDSHTDNKFGDGMATPERLSTSNDESQDEKFQEQWITPTNSELEVYAVNKELPRVYVDGSKTKNKRFNHFKQKSVSGSGLQGHIHDETDKDEFDQESKTSQLAIWRQELLSTDFSLIYGSLRAVLMKNLSKNERHLLIQTIIATMGEIEEVIMGEGNPVQQSVLFETPELNTEEEQEQDDDDEEEQEEKEEYKEKSNIGGNVTYTTTSYHTTRSTHSQRIDKLIKYGSDGNLTCVVCEKNLAPKENRCRGCQTFKWRVEKHYSMGEPLPICYHEDYRGAPKCRSCRFRKYCSLSMTETDIPVKSVNSKECPVCKDTSHSFRGWKCIQCYYFLLRLIRKKDQNLPTCDHIGKFVYGCDGCRYYNFGVEWAARENDRIFPLPLVEKNSIKRETS